MLKSLRVSTPSIFPPHSPHPNQETVGGIRQELVAPDDCAESEQIANGSILAPSVDRPPSVPAESLGTRCSCI